MTPRQDHAARRGNGPWFHGDFLDFTQDLIKAQNLCWAEVAAATVAFYLGKDRQEVLRSVLETQGLDLARPIAEIDIQKNYWEPLKSLGVDLEERGKVQDMSDEIIRSAISNQEVIILDWKSSEGGHCAAVTGYVSDGNGNVGIEIANPSGGRGLIALWALETFGWGGFTVTHSPPGKNQGRERDARREVDWSSLRAGVAAGLFLESELPTENLGRWGAKAPVIAEEAHQDVAGELPQASLLRWIGDRHGAPRIVDQKNAAGKTETLRLTCGNLVTEIASAVSDLLRSGKSIVAWVDSVESPRRRGVIVEDAAKNREFLLL